MDSTEPEDGSLWRKGDASKLGMGGLVFVWTQFMVQKEWTS